MAVWPRMDSATIAATKPNPRIPRIARIENPRSGQASLKGMHEIAGGKSAPPPEPIERGSTLKGSDKCKTMFDPFRVDESMDRFRPTSRASAMPTSGGYNGPDCALSAGQRPMAPREAINVAKSPSRKLSHARQEIQHELPWSWPGISKEWGSSGSGETELPN